MLKIKILNPEPSDDNSVWMLRSADSIKEGAVHVTVEWLTLLLHVSRGPRFKFQSSKCPSCFSWFSSAHPGK
jgi:hypothetical protein